MNYLIIPDQDSGHPVMIATEPDILEPAGVIFLMEEETSPSEDKVFFMDPGFSIPEHSDLLELDVDEDETLVPQDKETFGERPDHDD